MCLTVRHISNLQSLLLHLRSSRLCALSVWLVANYNLKFYYAEFCFFLALGAV